MSNARPSLNQILTSALAECGGQVKDDLTKLRKDAVDAETANARLIAAAPKLLRELMSAYRELVKVYNAAGYESEPDNPYGIALLQKINNIQAAITEARGTEEK